MSSGKSSSANPSSSPVGVSSSSNSSVHAKGAYTIMVYMCGSNLESDYAPHGETPEYTGLATANIKEMLSVDLPDDVNVIIETGGCTEWETDYGISYTRIGRWHCEDGSLVSDAQLGQADMGRELTFQNFMEWGLKSYPADHYGVVLWDHGGAMGGCCYDDNYDDDSLYNSEVHNALGRAFKSVGRTEKLDWIGYDCCLMSVQDIADFNSDYFDYMVASQELEPGEGWDYDTWLSEIATDVSIDTPTLLGSIADGFVSKCAQIGSSDATLSVLDLSKASAYRSAWEAMAAELSGVVDSSFKWIDFKTLCNKGLRFGYYDDKYKYYYDVFDVRSWCDDMQADATFGGIDSVVDVETALGDYVIHDSYGGHYQDDPKPCGLNFFCPVSGYSDSATYSSDETNFATWRSLVAEYGSFYFLR